MPAIKGLDQLQRRIEQIKRLPKAFGNEMLKRVKEKSPVRTGLLKDSWVLEVAAGVMNIKNTAKDEEGELYTPYVEYGTAKAPGQFMLTATVNERGDILKVAKKNVGL
jgi:hypothetical protein